MSKTLPATYTGKIEIEMKTLKFIQSQQPELSNTASQKFIQGLLLNNRVSTSHDQTQFNYCILQTRNVQNVIFKKTRVGSVYKTAAAPKTKIPSLKGVSLLAPNLVVTRTHQKKMNLINLQINKLLLLVLIVNQQKVNFQIFFQYVIDLCTFH